MSGLLLATDDGRSLRDLEDINFVEGKIQPADANTYLSVCYELRSNLSFLEINSSYYRQYYFLSQLPQFKNLKTLKIVNDRKIFDTSRILLCQVLYNSPISLVTLHYTNKNTIFSIREGEHSYLVKKKKSGRPSHGATKTAATARSILQQASKFKRIG
jgi:hypothetical protein